MDLKTFQALWSLEEISTSELPKFATELLAQNYDSESLCVLAGLDGSDWESVNFYFKKMLREMDIIPLKKREAGIILAKNIAKKIVSAEVDPEKGAREIWRISRASDSPKELDGFIVDVTDYEEHFPRNPEFLESITERARKLLG